MASKGKKRGHSGEHENHERWLLTYADMITLLVAFFIMLYAMSVMNVQKFEQLAVSVRSGFGGSVTNGTPTIMQQGGGITGRPSIITNQESKHPNRQDYAKSGEDWNVPSTKLAADQEDKRLDDLQRVLIKYIKENGLDKKVEVVVNERGMIIRLLTDKMLFDSGQADLRGNERGLLNEISTLLRDKLDNQVEVEGHTDDLPIHTARFPSNWELSTARATTVLRYLGDRGVPWGRLRAAGYADQRPVALNDSANGRRRNRRVDIVILRKYTGSGSGPIV
jgi:chemotaxis protein MotB